MSLAKPAYYQRKIVDGKIKFYIYDNAGNILSVVSRCNSKEAKKVSRNLRHNKVAFKS